MKQNFTTGLALAMALSLAMPAGAASKDKKDNDKSKDSFVSRLADAARDASAKAKKSKDGKTKKGDSSTTVSDLVKASDSKTKSKSASKVLVLPIAGSVQERAQEMVIFGKQPESLKRYVDTLRRARLDDNINSVVLRVGPNSIGMATVQELREAIAELQKQKKKVIAILEDDSQGSYVLASAADEVVMPPSADVMLHGVSADSYFLKNLLAKVGVKVQIIHIGQYKSYGETFTQDEFTTPAKQNMNEIVDSVYGQIKNMVAEGRKLSPEKVEEALNAGPIDAQGALKLGLIDRVAYADEVLTGLKKKDLEIVPAEDYKGSASSKSSSSNEISLLGLISMMSKSDDSDDSSTSDYPRVAVLYAVGAISLGSSGGSGLGSDAEIASQDFIEELEKLKNDDKIKAVILRVNSPGGSAFASDLIWKKIEELKTKKPVVASMGDMAASGGYYISMGASKIVAQPGTLTGSIGVVGGKPNLGGLYEKLGVNKTTISRGKYASMFSETQDFSPQEAEAVQGMMKRTYDEFVNKAAEGRKKTYDQVNEVAQGRVWTGEAAKEVGLVDELGGLDVAIVATKGLIGLKPDEKVRLIAYPKEKSLVDILQKAFGSSSSTVKMGTGGIDALLGTLPIPVGLQTVLQQTSVIARMFNQESVLTVMPVMIQLR